MIKTAIIKGYFMSWETNKLDVRKIIKPIIVDFEAAAPTYPTVASKEETGADKTSKIEPTNLGK